MGNEYVYIQFVQSIVLFTFKLMISDSEVEILGLKVDSWNATALHSFAAMLIKQSWSN